MLRNGDDIFDTTYDVDSIPSEEISPYLVRSPLEMEDRRAKNHDVEFTVDPKDETEEIVRGFILEKGIINEEHEKEKKEIIEGLMREREELIEKFKMQLLDVEKKVKKSDEVGHKQGRNSVSARTDKGAPMYIRLDKRNIIGAEDLLSRLQYDDRLESEKDTLERNLRDEKRLLRDRLELECQRKLQLETRRFEASSEDLRRVVKDLRLENSRLGKELANKELETKSRIAELKSHFNNEKAKFDMEKYNIRTEIERRHQKEMDLQRIEYERVLRELKNEFKEASRSLNKKEEQVSLALDSVKDYEARVRDEIGAKVKDEYEGLFDQFRHRNERLADQVGKLTQENSRLAGRLKELDDRSENRMSIVDEFTTRLNREYEDRLKSAVLENETLKAEVEELRKENRIQEGAVKDFIECTARLEEELTLKNGLLTASEETKESLRKEITDFSNEIDVLRREKSDLQRSVDEHSSTERDLFEKMSRKDKHADDALDKFRISERERMSLERRMALLSEEHEKCLQEIESLKNEIRKCDEEAFALKNLLDEERKEHDRFRDRFRRDAEEIRGKENECRALREQLRDETNKIDHELNKSAERVDTFMALKAENFELEKKLAEYEEGRNEMLRREREGMQRQFAKEFAKRVHTIKRSYEEAADGLKNQIKLLRSKVTELEALLASDVRKGEDHKYDTAAADMTRGKGLENADISQVGYLSKSLGREANSDYLENSGFRPSSVRTFDYASSGKPDTETRKIYRSRPVEEFDVRMYKTQNIESPARVCQGSFSRQRSRSLDSSSNRFVANGIKNTAPKAKVERRKLDDTNSKSVQIIAGKSTLAAEGRIKSPPTKLCFDLPKALSGNSVSQEGLHVNASQYTYVNGKRAAQSRCEKDETGNYDDVAGLPPKYTAYKSSVGSNRTLRAQHGNRQAGRAAENLEKSVEKFQERLEEGHDELLRRLELMQTSVR